MVEHYLHHAPSADPAEFWREVVRAHWVERRAFRLAAGAAGNEVKD